MEIRLACSALPLYGEHINPPQRLPIAALENPLVGSRTRQTTLTQHSVRIQEIRTRPIRPENWELLRDGAVGGISSRTTALMGQARRFPQSTLYDLPSYVSLALGTLSFSDRSPAQHMLQIEHP